MASVSYLMARSQRLAARSDWADNDRIINLMIALLTLLFFGLLLFSVLIMIRRIRQQQHMQGEVLPQYHDIKRSGNHHALTIQTDRHGRSSVLIFRDGNPMLANPHSPPHSPDNVPEIHITFPDEQDESTGQRKSGRVVVVRVGDNASVGLEPVSEQLPAYEKESDSQFQSIDIEKIGGLKEKDNAHFA